MVQSWAQHPIRSCPGLHRTLYLAPIAFVVLLAPGFPGLMDRLFEDGRAVVATAKGPIALAPGQPLVAGAVLPSASPTTAKLAAAEASPTALPPTVTLAPTAVPPTATPLPPTATSV